MIVSADDVRRLLAAGDPDAVLVVVEGRADVVSSGELDADAHRGALEVISRAELTKRVGETELSDHDAAEQAAILDAAVSELGG
jgi:aldehyde:ferredoxin oxidoreductase